MSFIGKFFSQEVTHAVDGFTSFLVTFDPETASEAQLAVFHEKFNELSIKVAQARSSRDKEKREAEEILALYNQRLKAAEILNNKVAAATSDEEKAAIGKSLSDLLTKLEDMKEDVEREKSEADEAEKLFQELSGYIEEFTVKMEQAKRQIEKAKAEMNHAQLEKERALLRANATEIKAGITTDKSDLNIVVNAFSKQAENSRIAADAANTRANLLSKSDIEKNDPLIASALKEASGSSTPAAGDFSARLAALKK